MKTLNGLRLQPLTSEHYCPWAADEDDVFDSVAHLAVACLGADDNATCGTKKRRGIMPRPYNHTPTWRSGVG